MCLENQVNKCFEQKVKRYYVQMCHSKITQIILGRTIHERNSRYVKLNFVLTKKSKCVKKKRYFLLKKKSKYVTLNFFMKYK